MSSFTMSSPYSSAQAREAMAATPSRPHWAAYSAALAVFSIGVTLISGCAARNRLHWRSACSWETISLIGTSDAPFLRSSR